MTAPIRSTLAWWHWTRATRALRGWVRAIAGPDHGYQLRFAAGTGTCYVNWDDQTLVVDPVMATQWGGDALVPHRWRHWHLTTRAQLDWHLSRALARHEALHIHSTESWNVQGRTHAWLTNALEDGRIERIGARISPAVWHDLVALGRIVWQQSTLPAPAQERLLAACLLHRWDVPRVRPRGAAAKVTFADPATAQTWETTIRPLVEQAWRVATCAEVAQIAATILQHLDLPLDAPALASRLPSGTDRAPDGLRRDGAAQEPPPPGTPDDEHTTPPDDTDPGEPDATTAPGQDATNADRPSDHDPSGGTRLMQPFGALEQAVQGDAQRLARRLQPPAPDVLARPAATSGRFDLRTCVRSQGATPFRVQRDPAPDPARGLAICVLVDETGSMGGYLGDDDAIDAHGVAHPDSAFHTCGVMPQVRRAVMLLDRTCAHAQIPLCIGLAARQQMLEHHAILETGGSVHPIARSSVTWLREFTTPPHAEGPRALIAGMYGNAEAEALSESMRCAQDALHPRREPTRVLIYIHDGQPTDESPTTAATTVHAVRSSGISVVGVFLGHDHRAAPLRAIFGGQPHETVVVPDATALADQLATVLRRVYR